MKVLQVNTVDTKGGAAIVAMGLHNTLRSAGHISKMLVHKKFSDDPDVHLLKSWRHNLKCQQYIEGAEKNTGLQYFFLCSSARKLLSLDIVRDADIIHFHNTHGGYLNLWAAGKLSRVKPVLWTLHDMWSITGHCAHSFDCEKWMTGCGDCPYLDAYPAIIRDTTHFLWNLKSRIYRDSSFAITVPSKWLMNKVRDSMLSHLDLHHVRNAVDTDTFHPREKAEVRSRLGLPKDRTILTFIAQIGVKSQVKGFDYLVDALSILRKRLSEKPFLIVIGQKYGFPAEDLGFDYKLVGEIFSPDLIAEYYCASDAFLIPSIAENSPLVALEAQACSTPVVAFDVGGVPEIVKHRETGYVAKYKDSEDFAGGIMWIMGLSKSQYAEVGNNGDTFVRTNHSLRHQMREFLNLYQGLIQSRTSGNPGRVGG